jgi:mycobactin peptide synthetase MbtE
LAIDIRFRKSIPVTHINAFPAEFSAADSWLRSPDPDLPAIETDLEVLSYAELARCVAARVDAMHAHDFRGMAVAIEMPRSVQYVITLLALLASRAVFMPVDPDLPPVRRSLMDEIVRPIAKVDALGTLHDLEGAAAASFPPEAAYVFFTSGSTGRPKAILGAHDALRNFIDWQGRTFDVGPGDRVAFLTSIGFDVSLRDILLPLRHGATLVIPQGETMTAPDRLVSWISDRAITRLHLVPSIARAWAQCGGPRLNNVKTLFSAGEKLNAATYAALTKLAPRAEIVNLYGPTETTLAKFFYRLPESFKFEGAAAPVGSPIPNSAFTLASNSEIIIHTPDASLGYIGASSEENARFVRSQGVTSYQTGDIGSINEEGLLVVAGRMDDQVKVNGVRVQLQEVERAVQLSSSVTDAKVVAIPTGQDGDLRLAVAWTGQSGDDASPRNDVLDLLPRPVVPTLWRRVDALPLNANGKIDAGAVSAMFSIDFAQAGRAAESKTEEWLCNAVSALLDCSTAAPDDDFFSLGGSSLQVAVLIGKIEREFGRRIDFADIFQKPKLAEIAATIDTAPASDGMTIDPVGERSFYDPSPQQRRWWNIYMPFGNRSWATMVRVLPFAARVSSHQVRSALLALIEEQDSLRITFDASNPTLRLKKWPVPDIGDVPVEDVDFSQFDHGAAAEALDHLRLQVANSEIATDQWPLFRCHAVAMPDGRSSLVFAMHHMVSDGFSMGLVETKLRDHIAHASTPACKRLPYNYLDYASWANAREAIAFGAGSAAEAHWAGVFNRPYSKHDFPELWVGPDHDRGQGYCRKFPNDLRRRIVDFARQHRVTMFSIYFAGKFLAWHKLLGRDDLVIGTPAAGRDVPGSDMLIGNFISLCCVRSIRNSAKSEPSVEYIRRIMVDVASAMSNQGYQYDTLVEKLGMPFEQDRFPLTTLFISYMNFKAIQNIKLNEAELGFSDLGFAVKFDMMSYVREHADCANLQIQYRNNLFEKDFIVEFADCWLSEIHALISSDETPALTRLN